MFNQEQKKEVSYPQRREDRVSIYMDDETFDRLFGIHKKEMSPEDREYIRHFNETNDGPS